MKVLAVRRKHVLGVYYPTPQYERSGLNDIGAVVGWIVGQWATSKDRSSS